MLKNTALSEKKKAARLAAQAKFPPKAHKPKTAAELLKLQQLRQQKADYRRKVKKLRQIGNDARREANENRKSSRICI